jgi:hypothetical protein
MDRLFRHIQVERKKDVFCVRLSSQQMTESDILEMADEVISLIADQGCRKMALCLGPGELEVLYSVFLAKLLMIRRRLMELGGRLKLCDASPETVEVFEACHLKTHFDFVPDQAAAVAALMS